MIKTKNKIIYICLFILFFNIGNIFYSNAAPILNNVTENQTNAFIISSEFNASTKIGDIIAFVIKGFLAILGIIFIILMLTAGYNWMTAGGEEEKITKAKNMIKRAIIGLFIVIASYAITAFVFKYLPWGTM
jgi:hypothetical protein